MTVSDLVTDTDALTGVVAHDISRDPFPVAGWDAVVWAAGNATQAALYFQLAFGMRLEAYSGPDTGNRDHHAYVLRAGTVRFVIKGAVSPDSPVADHHRRHGDGVLDVALEVPDVDKCVAHARAGRRAGRRRAPRRDRRARHRPHRDPQGLRRHHAHAGRPLPLPRPLPARLRRPDQPRWPSRPAPAFVALDHVVGNVELGDMDEWVAFYHRVMGFTNLAEFIGDDIATEYSALMSKVVASGDHRVKFPLNEPAAGQAQVADRRVPGVLRRPRRAAPGPRHARTSAPRVDALRARGVEFLATPGLATTPTRCCAARIGEVRVPVAELKSRGILVDRDEDGYLLQIFTKPIGDRPTVFFEFIERHGSLGFGKGNFQALFEAIEREQERRGNL